MFVELGARFEHSGGIQENYLLVALGANTRDSIARGLRLRRDYGHFFADYSVDNGRFTRIGSAYDSHDNRLILSAEYEFFFFAHPRFIGICHMIVAEDMQKPVHEKIIDLTFARAVFFCLSFSRIAVYCDLSEHYRLLHRIVIVRITRSVEHEFRTRIDIERGIAQNVGRFIHAARIVVEFFHLRVVYYLNVYRHVAFQPENVIGDIAEPQKRARCVTRQL